MRARIESWWERASTLQRSLAAGVPALVIAVAAIGVVVATASGGSGEEQVIAPTATATKTATRTPTQTPVPPTPTPTPEPATGGYTGGGYTGGGGGGGGVALTGPGPVTGTDMTLVIPKIGVNNAVYGRTVGTNGQMGDPQGAFQVIWYDFAGSYGPSYGGRPGNPGANIVMAGHVDYIGVGPAVFYSIANLAPGDIITIHSSTGSYNYAVQWSQWVDPNSDFTPYVAAQSVESVTLVTCIGSFSAGHYSNRIAVRATRV
jgi:LPXTG-site transpeptidase (sortase) family protein